MDSIRLKKISIENFRSIESASITLDNLNIFVGLNDSGKSNILKALNLFFNGETELGRKYDFNIDFYKFFNKKSHNAQQIIIKLDFLVPKARFADGGTVVWKKRFTAYDIQEEILREGKFELSKKSRIKYALHLIKYLYVPAVKSDNYFKELLASLYDSLSSSISNKIGIAIGNFTDAIQKSTEALSNDILQVLSLKSKLVMPEDLRNMFKTVIFNTEIYPGSEEKIALDFRGDGIKAYYIPIILNYISELDAKRRGRGLTETTTIWGFEEPENGMEIGKCYNMAQQILKYSFDKQILLTTHSPAFYARKNSCHSKLYYVYKSDNFKFSKIDDEISQNIIDANLGILSLITPYVTKYQDLINNTSMVDINTIMVEGKTDRAYFAHSIKLYSRYLQDLISKNKLRIFTRDDGCGTTSVANWVIAWSHMGYKSNLAAIFDTDPAGARAKAKIKEDKNCKALISKNKLKIFNIDAGNDIKGILSKIEYYYSVENLLPLKFWKKHINKLSVTDTKDLPNIKDDLKDIYKSYSEQISELVTDKEIRDIYIYHHLPDASKNSFCNFAICESNEDSTLFDQFKDLVLRLEKFFQ